MIIIRNKCHKFILVALCLALTPWVNASVELPSLFSDHMVLQRDKQVLFWGKTTPKQAVQVLINQQSVTTQADANGDWKVHFPAAAKGGPFKVSIVADETVELKDVYFGDVWIAGGQSNMEWKLGWKVNNGEQELLDANYPAIRFFDVPNTLSPNKESELPVSQWKLANSSNAAEFSAIAWFFAKNLHVEEDVAVGILDSNWGGTPAEAWTDADVAKKIPGYEELANKVLNTKNWPEIMAENSRQEKIKNSLMGNIQAAFETGAYKDSVDLSSWKKVSLPLTKPITDVVWLRRNFDLAHQPTSDVTINFGYIEQQAIIYLNDKQIGQKTWKDTGAKFTYDKSFFKKGTNVITLRGVNGWDNNVKIGRNNQMWVQTDNEKISLEGQWLYNNTIESSIPHVERYYSTTGFLYNAMMYPLLPYVAKGAIWYQGESNAKEHGYYRDLFSTMITNWRTRANNPALPFLFVQLAAFQQPSDLQPKSSWAYLRDAQKETLSLNNTGMALAIDIGDPNDIHPRNKQDVGKRLWLQAASKVYGKDVVASGPDYMSHTIQGDKVSITLDSAKGLTTTDSAAPSGFIIAGEDRKFYVAQATIIGNQVIITSPAVPIPVAVRYAWASYPNVNLVNSDKLPAGPFRTDNWLVETVH